MNNTNLPLKIDKFVLGTVITSVLIIVLGILSVNRSSSSSLPASKEQAQTILTVKSDDWAKGPDDAPITIVEYLDFECEACRVYYPITKRLKAEYRDKIRFVVRYFPLPGHKNSMTSALAAETAGKQGKFWEMHDILYEKQKDWGEKSASEPSIFEGYANLIGLNMERYKIDVGSKDAENRINRDKETGISLGVKGTPTFFINGEKIPNPKGYEDFKSLIDGLMPKTSN